MQRRLFILTLLMTMAMSICVTRLGWLQLGSTNGARVEASVQQREQAILLDDGRADFYDRSGVALTGRTDKVVAVFPDQGPTGLADWKWRQLCAVLQEEAGEVCPPLPHGKPFLWKRHAGDRVPLVLSPEQAMSVQSLHIPGVAVVPFRNRYMVPPIAAPLIGYIGQNPELLQARYAAELASGSMPREWKIGASGLEKTFELFLKGREIRSIARFTDATGFALRGLDLRMRMPSNAYYPLRVMTTLNEDIQQRIAQTMEHMHIASGAVVVLQIPDGDIVAMASRPAANPVQVNPEDESWRNMAITSFMPGSIFKTVVAATALEAGTVTPHTGFTCSGSLGKYGFMCWKRNGHGRLQLAEAYANSCNLAFAEVMRSVTSDQLETTAKALGAYGSVGYTGDVAGMKAWRQLDREDEGRLFGKEVDREDDGVRIQTAIGGRDVRMTPLQAANMVLTIMNDGRAMQPRIVSRISYRTGGTFLRFPPHRLSGTAAPIRKSTASFLKQAMTRVVEEGTGHALSHQSRWKLAGKSGTAEHMANGKLVQHQWFIGYGPVDDPAYAVCVLVANLSGHAPQQAIPLFREVMNVLAEPSAR